MSYRNKGRTCKQCGKSIDHRHGNAQYCVDCQAQLEAEREKAWRKKKQP